MRIKIDIRFICKQLNIEIKKVLYLISPANEIRWALLHMGSFLILIILNFQVSSVTN